MNRKIMEHIYRHLHRCCVKTRSKQFKLFSKCLTYHHGMTTLSNAIPGVYKFVAINCDKKLCHRLFEMGFILGKKLSVISTNTRGIIIIVKGAKIVLSNKIAEKIILKKE